MIAYLTTILTYALNDPGVQGLLIIAAFIAVWMLVEWIDDRGKPKTNPEHEERMRKARRHDSG